MTNEAKAFRTKRAAGELLIVFVGVTAAFLVEGYREDLADQKRLEQATVGLLSELGLFTERSLIHADFIDAELSRWEHASQIGNRAVPAHYRINGSPTPPTSAWDAAVSSGVSGMFEPDLQLAIGYFYNEFVGVHERYSRSLDFIEERLMPQAIDDVNGFYGEDGRLLGVYQVEMMFLREFATALRSFSVEAASLRGRLP